MSSETGQSHILQGFPAAAVEFVTAMQHNRERIAKDAGLTASELRAVVRIAAEVSVTPKELARHLDMTTAAITFISRRLVEVGLLHRVDHPKDRRSLYLELTPEGHRLMLDIHRDFLAFLDAATSDLSADAREDFTGALRLVAASMERQSPLRDVPARPSAVAAEEPGMPQRHRSSAGGRLT